MATLAMLMLPISLVVSRVSAVSDSCSTVRPPGLDKQGIGHSLIQSGTVKARGQHAISRTSSGSECNKNSQDSHGAKRLTFIHIPRTGGTTLEECTSDDPSQKWGALDPNMSGVLVNLAQFAAGKASQCYKTHVPPMLNPDTYAQRETFCAVRNPYTRAISQFGFAQVFYNDVGGCDVQQLNAKLLKDLTAVKAGDLYHSDCHYIPQAAYVYGVFPNTTKADTSIRMCKLVLSFENLITEFNELAQSHGYPYQLHNTTVAGGTRSADACHNLYPKDLSMEVRNLIEDIYDEDFRLFGYDKGV